MRFHLTLVVALVALTGTATALPVAIRPPANIKARQPVPVEPTTVAGVLGSAVAGGVAALCTVQLGCYLHSKWRNRGGHGPGATDIELQRPATQAGNNAHTGNTAHAGNAVRAPQTV